MIDLLSHPFMLRALVAAAVTGLAAPTIGTYLVQRRLALLGDGLGHVAVTGVALGLLTGTSPTWIAVVVAVLGAVAIEVIRERGHTNGDVALALLFYGGLAGGVLDHRPRRPERLDAAGRSSSARSPASRPPTWSPRRAGRGRRRALRWACSPQLFAVAQDPEFARVAGVPIRFYNLLVAVLAAVTVTVAMRTVGLLLVSALMVVPVATVAAADPLLPHHAGRGDGPRPGRLARRAAAGGVPLLRFDADVAPGPDDRAARPGRLRARPGRSGRGCAAREAAHG